jgi:hypothetical protein
MMDDTHDEEHVWICTDGVIQVMGDGMKKEICQSSPA